MAADQPYRKVDYLPDYQVRSLRFIACGNVKRPARRSFLHY